MARLRRLLMPVLALLAALVLVGVPSAASADVDDFVFESLDAQYEISRDDDGTSRMRVVETFVAVFPDSDQNRGMRRAVPTSYNDQPLLPELVSVTDEQGADRPAETDTDDGWFVVTSRADEYLHGRQVFVFEYELRNVVGEFADTGQEFYWDVNGTGWAQPFGSVTASVRFVGEVQDAVTGEAACYQGGFGDAAACGELEVTDDGAVASASDLSAGETLTVAVDVEDGTFTAFDTSFFASPWSVVQLVAVLGALAALGWAVVLRVRVYRHAPGRSTIIAEYEPPAGVDALEAAVLLGRTTTAIPAEVLEQAVVGSIRILEGERRRFGGAKLVAELVDPSRADVDGRLLLDGLFPDGAVGDTYEFGRQDTRFSKAAQQILSRASKELKVRGMYRNVPQRWRVFAVLVALVSMFGAIGFGIAAAESGISSVWTWVLLAVAAVLFAATLVVVIITPLSALGAETRDHLRGLREFIEWAEADRIRMLQSVAGAERTPVDTDDPRRMLQLYEALLPYAVVFGQERQWSERLAVLYTDNGAVAPTWYVGTAAFDASAFAAGIGTLSASAASSSSTSGGSSGGGSAGGGGGGGGGGGV